MASARVVSLASVVSLRAKDEDGEWRDLTEGSEVFDRDEILCEADGAQFALNAYKVQQRNTSAWEDAFTITLNVSDGTSNYRQDRISVEGDATDSTVENLLTVDKGERGLKDLLATLQDKQRARFTVAEIDSGATKFRGISDDIDHANKAEIGGFEQEYKGTILCDREQFAGKTIPKRGHKLTWLPNATAYRIVSVKEDEISFAIELESVNK